LVHYESLAADEAASVLEISIEALESLLARGRRTLRESLRALANSKE
jgi:RNA polymerase sigma-70 factor (ECF subfamily)